MTYISLVMGLTLLIFCGDLLVRGSVALAGRLSMPPIIIGLTIVAFGTSAPELVIAIDAALTGAPGIAVGNVVGSNIANILLVLGIPAVLYATDCDQPFVVRNALFMLGASVIFTALCFLGPLDVIHGVVLVALLAVFLTESTRRAMKAQIAGSTPELDDVGVRDRPWLMTGFVLAGLIGLPLAGHLTVESAVRIAAAWGVGEAVIGVTVVAVGTSLPELAAAVMAALRKQGGLAIGNVLGSNMFNLLAIMGITAIVAEVKIPQSILGLDVWVMLATALVLMPFVLARRPITRPVGLVFIAGYLAYVVAVFDGTTIGTAIAG